MATLVQSIWDSDGGADPAAITITEPTEGNLLLAVVTERSGGSAANHVLSDITGWTHTIQETTESGNGSYRRSFSVFWKIAGASEGTSLSADDGTSNNKWLTFLEYELEAGEDQFDLLESASNDNGVTSNATSLATGTTATVSGTEFLEFAVLIARRSGHTQAWTTSYTNGLAVDDDNGIGSNAMFQGAGSDGDDTTEEAKSSTISITGNDTNNSGLNAAILVFSLISAAGGLSIPIAAYHYNQMGRE